MADPSAAARTPSAGSRHALVLLGGDTPDRAALDAAWPGWSDGIADVIAADAGLALAAPLGFAPDLLVGDLDSLDPGLAAAAAAAGVPVQPARADKDETDAELAALSAVARGAVRLTIVGWAGGPRPDHALANVWLLAHPGLAAVDVVLLEPASRIRCLAAPGAGGSPATLVLPGPVGSVVSLLPMGGDATGITTHGLRYALRDETLAAGPARGVSNVRTAADASVTLRSGRLLVVEIAPAESGLSSGA